MEFSNTTQLIGKRIIWNTVMYLLYAIMFIGVSIWLYISMKAASNPDTFLVAMFYLTLGASVVFLTVTVFMSLRKNDAIYVDLNALIIRNIKDISIPFTDIENIQMTFYKHPINKKICKRYTSGIIVITLKNNKKIYVRDIKDLENVCYSLRKIVLNR